LSPGAGGNSTQQLRRRSVARFFDKAGCVSGEIDSDDLGPMSVKRTLSSPLRSRLDTEGIQVVEEIKLELDDPTQQVQIF
jgi:hypothetical protein